MKKRIILGIVIVSVLIVLASLPSVVASQANQPSEITSGMKEIVEKKLKCINGDSPLVWEPGLIIAVFIKVLELYIDYVINNGWFPGLTLLVMYLFMVLVILCILFNNP